MTLLGKLIVIGVCNNIHNNYRSIVYQTIPLPEKSRIHAA